MNYHEIINAYNDAERSHYETAMQQIREIKEKLSATQEEYYRRRLHASELVDTLKKFGLQVTSVSGSSVYARPIPGGKFRFVKFDGYTARGDGRNRRRLEARALTLVRALSAATGLRVNVNEFSLEIDKPDKEQTQHVIINIYV